MVMKVLLSWTVCLTVAIFFSVKLISFDDSLPQPDPVHPIVATELEQLEPKLIDFDVSLTGKFGTTFKLNGKLTVENFNEKSREHDVSSDSLIDLKNVSLGMLSDKLESLLSPRKRALESCAHETPVSQKKSKIPRISSSAVKSGTIEPTRSIKKGSGTRQPLASVKNRKYTIFPNAGSNAKNTMLQNSVKTSKVIRFNINLLLLYLRFSFFSRNRLPRD